MYKTFKRKENQVNHGAIKIRLQRQERISSYGGFTTCVWEFTGRYADILGDLEGWIKCSL